MPSRSSLSVAVLVDLVRHPASGGHVKCWERFAAAAAGEPELDLTIYVLADPAAGPAPAVDAVSANVRFVALRPIVPSALLHGLVGGVDASDLAPFHRGLAGRLHRHDVWHVTHTMSFAATALRMAAPSGRHLVGSVHTDVPALTRVYAREIADRVPGPVPASVRRRLADHAAGLARRRRDAILAACRRVLVSSDGDRRELSAVVGPERLSRLRRGIDSERFRPDLRDRTRLRREHGIPADVPLVLFAGRVDATKGALRLARAVARVRAGGTPLHLVVAGEGAQARAVGRELGSGATLLGAVSQDELAWIAASCDFFALPSRTETIGNVVAEAMACGLPVVLPAGERTAQWTTGDGIDAVLVPGDATAEWAAALATLARDPQLRRRLGVQARRTVERCHPTWQAVLAEDLLPVWRTCATEDARGPATEPAAAAPATLPPP